MGKIFAVTNQKGGVGKTTTSINLSACLAAQNKKALLIDLDPQGNSTSGLGQKPGKESVYEVLLGDASLQDALRETCQPRLSLLPADIRLAGAEIELVGFEKREYRLRQALESVRAAFDYILIDCPPSLNLLTLNALTAADGVIIPIQCEYYALEGVSALMNTVTRIRQSFNPALEIEGILLTMYDGRTNLCLQVAHEVKKHFKSKVFSTLIPRNVRLGEAPSHGLPIHLYDAGSTGAQAYTLLAQEIIKKNRGKNEKMRI